MKLIRINSRYRGGTLRERRGSLVKSDSTSSENGDTPTQWCWTNQKKVFVGTGVIAVIVSTLILTLSLNIDNLDSTKIFALERTAKLGEHKLLTREIWGGIPAMKWTRSLRHPVNYVLISHTAGSYCDTISECSIIMQQIQDYHISLNSPDVGYNFLIGGDGNIYVARGWDIVNYHVDGCIGISFIGNFMRNQLTDGMIEAAKMLLEQGIALGKLSTNYHLVAHNQTYATLSPGTNVYREIKKWSHFLPGSNISWSCKDCVF